MASPGQSDDEETLFVAGHCHGAWIDFTPLRSVHQLRAIVAVRLACLTPLRPAVLGTQGAVTMERAEDQNAFATESLCPGRQFSGFPVYKGFSCAASYLIPGRQGETLPPAGGKIEAQNSSVTQSRRVSNPNSLNIVLSKHYLFRGWAGVTTGALWDVPLGRQQPDTAPRPGTRDGRQPASAADTSAVDVSHDGPVPPRKSLREGHVHTSETQDHAPREPPSPLRDPPGHSPLDRRGH